MNSEEMKLSNEEILVAFCLSNIPDIITQEEKEMIFCKKID